MRVPRARRSPGGAAAVDFLIESLRAILPPFEQVVEGRHDSDADDIVMLRNVPEPSLLVRGLQYERGAFIFSRAAPSALPVGPDGAFISAPDPRSAT